MTGFNIYHQDNRKKERLTFRLDKYLYDKIISDKDPASEIIRSALNEYFSKMND